MLTFTQTLNN